MILTFETLASIFADFEPAEKAKMSQWNLCQGPGSLARPCPLLCNSFVPLPCRDDLHRLRHGLHDEKCDAAFAKFASAADYSNAARSERFVRIVKEAAFSALARAAIPLAKRVTDCFKSSRLRRQSYGVALGRLWSRTICWAGRASAGFSVLSESAWNVRII